MAAVMLGDSKFIEQRLKDDPIRARWEIKDESILEWAVQLNQKQMVVLLLDLGIPVNYAKVEAGVATKRRLSWSALHAAAWYGNEEIAKLLIDRKADVDNSDEFGETPLHHAAQEGSVKVAKLLLEVGANVNAKDNRGNSPLALTPKSNKELIELFEKYGGK